MPFFQLTTIGHLVCASDRNPTPDWLSRNCPSSGYDRRRSVVVVLVIVDIFGRVCCVGVFGEVWSKKCPTDCECSKDSVLISVFLASPGKSSTITSEGCKERKISIV